MEISAAAVKALRERTGAAVMSCKKALVEAEGDFERAIKLLREWGLAIAERKGNRVASQGLIEAYLHAGGRIGAMVELNCETDFVARTEQFKALAHDLAMQVAATNPRYITAEEMPPGDDLDAQESCLLLQPFIKDPNRSVQERINETIAQVGERIVVRRMARFELGQ